MMAVVEVVVASVAAFFPMKSLLVETRMTSMMTMMTTERVRFRKSRRVRRRKWCRKCRLTHTKRKGKKRRWRMKQHVKSDVETVSGGEHPGEEEMSLLTQISLERSD